MKSRKLESVDGATARMYRPAVVVVAAVVVICKVLLEWSCSIVYRRQKARLDLILADYG